jgi:hypothetical protein
MWSVTGIIKDELTSIGEMIITIITLPLGLLAVLVFCYILLFIISSLDKFYNLIIDFIEQIRRK